MPLPVLSCYPAPMIPPIWQECRRPDDDERVGYLVPTGELFIPVTLVGLPLGAAQAEADATALLHERGLMTLNGRWWCLLPEVLLGTRHRSAAASAVVGMAVGIDCGSQPAGMPGAIGDARRGRTHQHGHAAGACGRLATGAAAVNSVSGEWVVVSGKSVGLPPSLDQP